MRRSCSDSPTASQLDRVFGSDNRDGAFQLLRRARRLFPFIRRIFADGGYAGEKMALIVWRTGHGGSKS
jgi:hypothetical protein